MTRVRGRPQPHRRRPDRRTSWPHPRCCRGGRAPTSSAHLALNGEALAGVLDGVVRGEPWPMYESDEQRDADIEELAAGRRRPSCATGCWPRRPRSPTRSRQVDDDHWGGDVRPATPGGPRGRWRPSCPTRRRELEIHHVDLGASYTRPDWPDDFVARAARRGHGRPGRRRVRSWSARPTSAATGPSAATAGPTVTGTRRRPRLVAHRPRRRRGLSPPDRPDWHLPRLGS